MDLLSQSRKKNAVGTFKPQTLEQTAFNYICVLREPTCYQITNMLMTLWSVHEAGPCRLHLEHGLVSANGHIYSEL